MNDGNEISIDRTRVIGVFAHVDAGKTTTSEAILYYTGRIHRIGSVDEGNAQLDWMEEERARGITITSAATTCSWHDHRINLIDTPGHIDFSAEVVRSIRVIDGAVMVLCGVGGVEPQTRTVWMHANDQSLPRVIFVNKLDRLGSDFERVLEEIREELRPPGVPLQLPIGREGKFTGLVDLIEERALVWGEGRDDPEMGPVPTSMADRVASARASLLDAVCETDDGLLEARLEGRDPDAATLRRALRRATIAGTLVPVVCGSARRRIGVRALLDAVVAYLPAPVDMPPVMGTDIGDEEEVVERPSDPDAPLCAYTFKIVRDPHVGYLAWNRIFSGRLGIGATVYNPRIDEKARVGRIYRMHANRREQVERATVGDVIALVGVRSTVTGDTLCDPEHPIVLESVTFPEPVIVVALTPSSDDEQERLQQAVRRLCDEDPTLVARYDPETGEETLSGMGELHLEVAADRLRTEFGLAPIVSPAQVAYRETVCRVSEATGTYRRQSGGHGHYAQVRLRVEPLPRGEGIQFMNMAPSGRSSMGNLHGRYPIIPDAYVGPAELGIREALEKGIVAGYPVTDVRVTMLGGRVHEVDSSGQDFEIAGSMAVRRAVRKAQPALLEPVMEIDVALGEQHLGSVTADFGRRRGSVKAMAVRGNTRTLNGEVPLTEVRGYVTVLRSLTQGYGTFTMAFRRYDLVPEYLVEEIVEQRQAEGRVGGR